MNEEKNLLYLVDIVSSHTKQDPALVRKFLHRLFKEIEKELVTSSFVNIDGLGIFKVIKSIHSDRILFLGKFESEKEKHIELPESDEGILTEYPENQNQVSSFESFVSNKPQPEEDAEEEDAEAPSFNPGDSFDTTSSNNVFLPEEAPENENDKILNDFLLEDYQSIEDEGKRKKRTIIQIVVLLLITVAAVIFLLFTLYHKDKRDEIISPIVQTMPEYTVLNNDDSLNISIRLESNADYLSLSQVFYGHEDFWGYIYQENSDSTHTQDPFVILTSKTIVKIPHLTVEQQNIDSAKIVANNIFENIRNRHL